MGSSCPQLHKEIVVIEEGRVEVITTGKKKPKSHQNFKMTIQKRTKKKRNRGGGKRLLYNQED